MQTKIQLPACISRVALVGFMGAVVLVMGAIRGTLAPPEDVQLVDKTVQTLEHLASTKENQLADQCRSTLTTLLDICYPEKQLTSEVPSKIRIPYFGTLYVTSVVDRDCHSIPNLEQGRDGPDKIPEAPFSAVPQNDFDDFFEAGPTIAYRGLYDFDYEMDWIQNEPGAMPDSLDLMGNLDEAWETFLNPSLR